MQPGREWTCLWSGPGAQAGRRLSAVAGPGPLGSLGGSAVASAFADAATAEAQLMCPGAHAGSWLPGGAGNSAGFRVCLLKLSQGPSR